MWWQNIGEGNVKVLVKLIEACDLGSSVWCGERFSDLRRRGRGERAAESATQGGLTESKNARVIPSAI